MSDSNHTITFNKVSPGTPGAGSLNSFQGTNATCPVCGASVPITVSDIAAYTSAHGQPQPVDVFVPVVEHGTGPKTR